jgi:hypothetical protein
MQQWSEKTALRRLRIHPYTNNVKGHLKYQTAGTHPLRVYIQISYTHLCHTQCGSDSVAGIATGYSLDDLGIHPASYKMGIGSPFAGLKRPGCGVDHPPPYDVEVKDRVELYLYSRSWPS